MSSYLDVYCRNFFNIELKIQRKKLEYECNTSGKRMYSSQNRSVE